MTVAPVGTEWVVDAYGCDQSRLASLQTLERLFAMIVRELELTPVGAPAWHVFPGAGGITGILLLSESHLACHTFPERGFAALNLYSCHDVAEWPWADGLREAIGAATVIVRTVPRGNIVAHTPATAALPISHAD